MSKSAAASFPKRFLWGVSLAAHQVEGGTHNQWTAWELDHAKTLAMQAEYQFGDLQAWPAIKVEAKNPGTYVSGRAVEHYDRFEADFDIAQSLNVNALRFSVEWSRIEPKEGAWDVTAIEHYKRYVANLKKRGIEPMLTLFHFTLPVWFSDKGGFEKRANTKYFLRFTEKILSELGSDITYIITINEPEVYVAQSYYLGKWPPGRQSKLTMLKVYLNLAYTHNQTARLIHSLNRRYKVSVAKNSNYIYPGDDARLSVISAHLLQYFQDDFFIKRVIKQCDFLGVNYYFSNRVYGYRIHNSDRIVSDKGDDMSPDDIEYVLERLYRRYKKPIIITENGCADASDKKRQWWLTRTLLAMQRAVAEGVDLRGYLHWSLLDNFEWSEGTWPRFGLVAVDYKTMERTIRPSGRRYGAILKKLRGV